MPRVPLADIAYSDINVTFDLLVDRFVAAAQAEAEDYWNRAAQGGLFDGES